MKLQYVRFTANTMKLVVYIFNKEIKRFYTENVHDRRVCHGRCSKSPI